MAEKHGYYVTLPIGRKGMEKKKKRRGNEYTAIVTEQTIRRHRRALLDKLYEGDAKGLVSTLIQRNAYRHGLRGVEKVLGRWKRQ